MSVQGCVLWYRLSTKVHKQLIDWLCARDREEFVKRSPPLMTDRVSDLVRGLGTKWPDRLGLGQPQMEDANKHVR